MGQLPTFKELEARFKMASELRITPYNWIPPLWEDLHPKDLAEKSKFPDTSADTGTFDGDPETDEKRAVELRNAIPKMVQNANLPSPLEDFSHLDPEQLSDDDIDVIAKSAASSKGPTLVNSLGKLRLLAGANSPGMQRLDLVFQWVVGKFSQLCINLNAALDERNRNQYNQLRAEYIELLRDLDDHEPQKKGVDEIIREKGKRGYGRAMKWVYADPVIFGGRIIGLRVIVHWNPHSSSSGKPILH